MSTDKKFWNSEKLIGLSALFVSLLTLAVFAYQTTLIRKQQYMSVYPHLNLTNYNSWSLNYKYVLKNEGVGPAFIKAIRITESDGTAYDELLDYVEAKIVEQDSIWFHYSDIYEGKLVSADEEIILFGLSDLNYTNAQGLSANTIDGANKLRTVLNTDSVKIEVEYESIYGERWSVFNHTLSPVKHEP